MKTGGRKHTGFKTGRILAELICLAAAAILLQAAFYFETARSQSEPERVSHIEVKIGGGRTIHLVRADLTGGDVELLHVKSAGYPARERFGNFTGRAGARAAVNGCFFDLNTGALVGHVYVDGRRETEGSFGAAFAVGKDNKAAIAPLAQLGDTSKYKLIVTCVDILIRNGEVLVKSRADLVRNGHSPARSNDVFKPARWSAVGIGRDGAVYFVGTSNVMTIYEFAREVKEHTEITDLLGLDGGSSSGLYVGGKTVIRPSRAISSAILVRAVAPREYIAKAEAK